MDDRSGQIYPSVDAARAAGVPEEHTRPLAPYIDARHCAACSRPVKVRPSTPWRQGSDGLLYRWCKKCWYKKGAGGTKP